LDWDAIRGADKSCGVSFDASSNIVSIGAFINVKTSFDCLVNPNFEISGFNISELRRFENPMARFILQLSTLSNQICL
jgi:hypothetical protein